MKKITFLFSILYCLHTTAQNENYLLIGTYTSGKSEGIYVYKFNSTTGANNLLSTIKTSNPSFLAVSPNKKNVYAANEDADSTIHPIGGTISSFSFNNGKLTEINKLPSGGKHPCYVTVDKTGKWLFAGNYSSGTVGLLPIKKGGALDTIKQIIQHNGSGPNEARQQSAHVHGTFLSADNGLLYVPDLGIDKLMMYTFDNNKGKLQTANPAFVSINPGSGPRHLDISSNGKFIYLVLELTGEVTVLKNSGHNNFQSIQSISLVSPYYKGIIGGADIHLSPDGRFLYASNRGNDNSIAIFAVNTVDGKLTWIGSHSTLGATPRNFNFDPSGNFLLVANQNSDDITIFRRNKKTGLLADTGKKINVPNPVCIKWIPMIIANTK